MDEMECDSSPDGKHRMETVTRIRETFGGETKDEWRRCRYCERKVMADPGLTAMAILTMDVNGADERMASYLKGVETVYELRMARQALLSAVSEIEAEIRARAETPGADRER